MEEFNKNFNKLEKPRSKKINSKIDLAPMVSVSFLLIIFFMITIELSKPRAIQLGMPIIPVVKVE